MAVLINYGTAGVQAEAPGLRPGTALRPLYPRWAAGARAAAGGTATVTLAPQSVRVFDLR